MSRLVYGQIESITMRVADLQDIELFTFLVYTITMPGYEFISPRDVLLDRILSKFSEENRTIIDFLYGARASWNYMKELKSIQRIGILECPITDEMIQYCSMVARKEYIAKEREAREAIKQANKEIPRKGKKYKHDKNKFLPQGELE